MWRAGHKEGLTKDERAEGAKVLRLIAQGLPPDCSTGPRTTREFGEPNRGAVDE